ncbi:MAG: metallophosphoesterase, partial [Nitrososphaeraceae archaeon]|nr:metallophosphoesterase [Nitrososphaeraceae archaeon]
MDYKEVTRFMDIQFINMQNVYAVEVDEESGFYNLAKDNSFDYVFEPSDYYIDENFKDRLESNNILNDGDGVAFDNLQTELQSHSRVVPESKNISNFNFVAVGDFYCNHETEDTIQNILKVNPELIITTGDNVKNVKSAKCCIKDSQLIKDKMRIAIGNHDLDSKKLYKQIIKYHGLTNPYYSDDFKTIHFVTMST